MSIIVSNAATAETVATFGHVARAGTAAITDALSSILQNAPAEPQARASVREHALALKDAESFLGRAYLRLIAIGQAAQPYLGQRYNADFVEAANAADLLVASDILMALLLDSKIQQSPKLAYLLGIFLPEVFPRPEDEVEFTINTTLDESAALLVLHDEEEPVRFQPLAAWHDDVLRGNYACLEQGEGFLADVALVREQLFETYLDRDCNIPEERQEKPTLLVACAHAVNFGMTLAQRSSLRRQRALA